MTEREFIEAVERAGDLDERAATRAAESVLATLGGAVDWGEAQNIADNLPPRLARIVRSNSFASSMARFARPAFVREVAERAGTTRDQAVRDLDAVMAVLDGLLPPSRRSRLRSELTWMTSR